VFVIDSGVNPAHSHVERVAGGARIYRGEDGALRRDARFEDEVGHGTAITAVVRHVAPAAEVFAVKIFGRALTATVDVLERAIEFALRSKARVVNLSLAVAQTSEAGRVGALCREAVASGVVLVAAAAAGRGRGGFPAILPDVIGAVADGRLGEQVMRHVAGAALECRAAGWPRALPGLPRARNFKGHSFAAARVSGVVACILEARPDADLAAVREELALHFG
jgi:subtilase family protein